MFTSSIFAKNYEEADKPIKFTKIPNVDYMLFTNIPKNKFNTSWEIIEIRDFLNPNITSIIIKSRYPKFMAWEYIRTVLKLEYDVIFYMDAIYYPKPDKSPIWMKLANEIKSNSCGLMQQKHIRDAHKECYAIVRARKDSKANMQKMK